MESHGMCSFSEFFIIENSHTYKKHTHTHTHTTVQKIKQWLTTIEIISTFK